MDEKEQGPGRALLDWLKSSPALPEGELLYGALRAEAPCLALIPLAEGRTRTGYITGGAREERLYKLVLRLRPGPAEGCRLAADEALERVAAWAQGQKPSLGEGLRALELARISGPALDRAAENGREDRQITFRLRYEIL